MLSILHREMRVASRRRWTFRARLLTNVFAFILSAPLIVFGSPDRISGATVFRTLTVVAFFFCLIQGVRDAASSIATEKREGTLGLLFLTDLKPLEIVLGKFCAIAVPMVQPLLAFVPFLAVSMLIGGVTFGEVARAWLVFAAMLLYSISIGMLISAQSRGVYNLGNSTLVLLLLLVFVPSIGFGKIWYLRLLTPWTAFHRVGEPEYRVNPPEFWWPVAATLAVGALALLAAAFFLPRRWEQSEAIEKTSKTIPEKKRRSTVEERARILDRNPAEWLATRYAAGGFGFWFFNFAIALLAGAGVLVAFNGGGPLGMIPNTIGFLFLLLRMASMASFPLAEARRTGAIEMLLSTPLNPSSLIRGQIAALWRQFRISTGIVSIASVAIMVGSTQDSILNFFVVGWSAASGALWILGVSTMGMWMGLRSNSPNAAFFKTIVFGIIAPFAVCQAAPLLELVLFAVATSQITGRELRRLLGAEKATVQPAIPPMITAAKPV